MRRRSRRLSLGSLQKSGTIVVEAGFTRGLFGFVRKRGNLYGALSVCAFHAKLARCSIYPALGAPFRATPARAEFRRRLRRNCRLLSQLNPPSQLLITLELVEVVAVKILGNLDQLGANLLRAI